MTPDKWEHVDKYTKVMNVPGGWLYLRLGTEEAEPMTFVPWPGGVAPVTIKQVTRRGSKD